jgi:hypothetical protein
MKPSNPNNMHIGGDGKHPFPKPFSQGNHRVFSKMVGVKTNPGGEGKLESANASMKKKSKGGMRGPGEAG